MHIDKEQLKQIILKEIKQNLSEQAQPKEVYVSVHYGHLRDGTSSTASKIFPMCVGNNKKNAAAGKHVRCLAYGDKLVISDVAAAAGFHEVFSHTRNGQEIHDVDEWKEKGKKSYVSIQHISTKLRSKADKLAALGKAAGDKGHGEAAFIAGARG
jgi:hypothetical protein